MYFSSLADFVAMGGHGPFVWAAYSVTLAALMYLCIKPSMRIRALRQQVRNEARIQQRRKEQNNAPRP